MPKRQRLDAYLAHAGIGSRGEVKKMIKRGYVTIDEVVCKSPKEMVCEEVIACNGEVCVLPPESVDAILYKPLGYACSHDPREAPLVDELLPSEWAGAGVEMAGRLDRETSGLLILTTNGQRIHQLINPKKKVPKRYQITYTGKLQKNAVQICAEGLQLENEEHPCRPAELSIGEDQTATLILHEGKYHQVRRMIAALGGEVTALHRDKVGGFELPTKMEPGDIAVFEDDTWYQIFSEIG